MKIASMVCVGVLAVMSVDAVAAQTKKAPAAAAKAPAGAVRTVEITGSETMKYDVTAITAKPGEKIRVVLKAVGAMPKIAMGHNFVLLKLGVSPLDVSNAAFNARATDFVPAEMKDKIIAATKLAGGGETVEVTFTAPTKAGSYDYLCTFPGHFSQGMKGTLTVK